MSKDMTKFLFLYSFPSQLTSHFQYLNTHFSSRIPLPSALCSVPPPQVINPLPYRFTNNLITT